MNKLRDLICNPEAEAALIASILYDPTIFPRVKEFVNEHEFVEDEAKQIFKVIDNLYKEKQPIEPVAVNQILQDQNVYHYLVRASDLVTGGGTGVYYANIVHKKFLERELSNLIQHGYMALQDTRASTNEKIQTLSSMLSVAKNFGNEKEELTVNKMIKDLLNQLTEQGTQPISSGFNNLDKYIGGLGKGQFILIAGATSMGKTSMLMDIYIHCARIGARPYYYYLEMLAMHLAQRMVMNIARVSSPIDPDDDNVRETLMLTEHWPAWIEGKPHRKLDGLITDITAAKHTKDIGVVFIDHIQKIQASGRDTIQQMTEITGRLSELAVDLEIPVVAACQLNRNTINRDSHAPKITDLRGSGTLEHDSDVVLLLHRDDYYREMEEESPELDGKAQCYVAKNRHGKKGIVNLIWLPEYCSFADMNEIPF